MNKHSFRKLATVGAAAALSLQLVAGVASAAVAHAGERVRRDGDASPRRLRGLLRPSRSTAQQPVEAVPRARITGGTSVPVLLATKNSAAVKGCSVQASPNSP